MKILKNALIVLLSIFLFLFESCNRNELTEETLPVTSSKNFYITGAENNKAYYWKNGEKIILAEGDGCYASNILINNNRVYVLGGLISEYGSSEYNTNKYLWIDGVKHNLAELLNLSASNPNSSEYSVQGMAINKNGNIVFHGWTKNPNPTSDNDRIQACYWENGEKKGVINCNDMVRFYFDPANGDVYTSVRSSLISNAGTNEYGWYISYYKNGLLISKDKNVITQYFYSDNTGVNVFYKYYDNTGNNNYKLYQKNLGTEISSILPDVVNQNLINKFFVEGNNKYFIGDDFYIKNNVLLTLDSSDGFNKIGSFQVVDNNIYSIRNHSNNLSAKFFINNLEKQSILLTPIHSGNASGFTSLYISDK
ncbi:hypothetical protein [Epilithonimonas mollis]|uniref:Uncharacterized protein n=1 Tax=Epilithonimonas mollis TaxID=216903 RepID=A0A1M6PFU1_9FLAO|nr:hypothetical protein [Epilithonimonas mollis]SHK06828.1 hypothetical protein SAMN05444371_1072 [Epilithonimonas mollis]